MFSLKPFETNCRKGSVVTPITTGDLFFGDAISIPTAPTKSKRTRLEARARISSPRRKDSHAFATSRKDEAPPVPVWAQFCWLYDYNNPPIPCLYSREKP